MGFFCMRITEAVLPFVMKFGEDRGSEPVQGPPFAECGRSAVAPGLAQAQDLGGPVFSRTQSAVQSELVRMLDEAAALTLGVRSPAMTSQNS